MIDDLKSSKGYLVGYGKPPQHSRFKKGVCPNPKGRGKEKFVDIGQSLETMMDERIAIRIGSLKKTVPRREAKVWKCVHEAMNGNLGATEIIVGLLTKPEKKRRFGVRQNRYEKDVMRDLSTGLLPKNTIIRRDLLDEYAEKKKK